ncbi:MAG: hypothetical protein J1E36_05450 [Eubacterium sp.]|nr:hypothetical protein [Eubacterium sp.]
MNENTKRTTKKLITDGIKVLSFILVFVILLELLSATIFSKSSATTYKNKFKNAYNFVNEVEDTIDIVALGNSNMYSAIIPVRLWDKKGYTSTVVASPRQSVSLCYELLNEVTQTQSPKFVILETDTFYEGVELNTDLVDGEPAEKDYLKFVPYISDNYLSEAVQNRFSVFLFHDRWKKMIPNPKNKEKNTNSLDEDYNYNHGYVFIKKIKKISPNDNMNYTDALEKIPQEAVFYLSKITTFCKDNDIQLMLITVPSLNTWSYARHNAVKEYADNNNIPYFDFNALEDYEINYDKDFRDNGNHMNYYGAKKITNYIGNYINENYSDIIEDKRENADYSYWYDDKERFITAHEIKKF